MKLRTSTKLAIGCLALLSSTASFAETRFVRVTKSFDDGTNSSLPAYEIRPSLSADGTVVMYTTNNSKDNVWTQSVQMDRISLANTPTVLSHIEFPTGAPAGVNTYVSTSPSMNSTGSIVAIAPVYPKNSDSEYRDHLRIFSVGPNTAPQLIFEKAGKDVDSVNSVRVSPNGKFVAYELVTYLDDSQVDTQIYVYDVASKSEKKMWSKVSDWTEIGVKGISDDGNRILLGSSGESDTAGDNLSLLDLKTGKVTQLTNVKDLTAGPCSSSWDANGVMTAFASSAPLVKGDTNRALDVFLVQTTSPQSIMRISMPVPGAGATQGNFSSGQPEISKNGKFVAFVSRADNLIKFDANYAKDLFVYSLDKGTLVSSVRGNDDINLPSVSNAGNAVAFVSGATNIVAGDTNKAPDVFVGRAQ